MFYKSKLISGLWCDIKKVQLGGSLASTVCYFSCFQDSIINFTHDVRKRSSERVMRGLKGGWFRKSRSGCHGLRCAITYPSRGLSYPISSVCHDTRYVISITWVLHRYLIGIGISSVSHQHLISISSVSHRYLISITCALQQTSISIYV